MQRFLAFACLILAIAFSFYDFPNGAIAALLVVTFAAPTAYFLFRSADGIFLTRLFVSALMVRLLFGFFVLFYDAFSFFGGDATTYDSYGRAILEVWMGSSSGSDFWTRQAMSTGTPGWGINYLVAVIYLITGPNHLAAQSFCALIGAATAPLAFFCSSIIFRNRRVAVISALLVGFFPAFIIWSSQLMKDGLIIFLLVLVMTMVVRLQQQFSYVAVILLILALFGILALRFYIFYMVAIAVAGSFVIGQAKSVKSVTRGFVLLLLLGLSLTYLGVLRTATENFEKFGSLERLQRSREDLAKRADSGFGDDLDVTTAEGALTAIPVGLAFLMLAPFPWQIGSFRQTITLPEVLIWWSMIPLLFSGLAYTIRHRLREAIPILIFTLMLTIAYSIFQGNVGTAYRQRTQIQVFLFMFIAVGWTIMQEKRENRRASQLAAQRAQEARLEARGAGS